MQQNKKQWREVPLHWRRARHSVNEGFGKEFCRQVSVLKGLGPFSELPENPNRMRFSLPKTQLLTLACLHVSLMYWKAHALNMSMAKAVLAKKPPLQRSRSNAGMFCFQGPTVALSSQNHRIAETVVLPCILGPRTHWLVQDLYTALCAFEARYLVEDKDAWRIIDCFRRWHWGSCSFTYFRSQVLQTLTSKQQKQWLLKGPTDIPASAVIAYQRSKWRRETGGMQASDFWLRRDQWSGQDVPGMRQSFQNVLWKRLECTCPGEIAEASMQCLWVVGPWYAAYLVKKSMLTLLSASQEDLHRSASCKWSFGTVSYGCPRAWEEDLSSSDGTNLLGICLRTGQEIKRTQKTNLGRIKKKVWNDVRAQGKQGDWGKGYTRDLIQTIRDGPQNLCCQWNGVARNLQEGFRPSLPTYLSFSGWNHSVMFWEVREEWPFLQSTRSSEVASL